MTSLRPIHGSYISWFVVILYLFLFFFFIFLFVFGFWGLFFVFMGIYKLLISMSRSLMERGSMIRACDCLGFAVAHYWVLFFGGGVLVAHSALVSERRA